MMLWEQVDATPKRRHRTATASPPVACLLDPKLSAWLAERGVDLLLVEVVTPTEVVIHNGRDWRTGR